MTESLQQLREEYRKLGVILPEWLLRLNPVVEGDYVVVEDSTKGRVYFPKEQFTPDEVFKRYELITRFSN